MLTVVQLRFFSINRIRNRIGSSCSLRLSANGRPAAAKGSRAGPGTRSRTAVFFGVPPPRLERRGGRHLRFRHEHRCLDIVESIGHGVSPRAEEASSPYGATDRGRSSCPNQASHGSIRWASATRVRSNAPGHCSNCLKQRPTRPRGISVVSALTVHHAISHLNRRRLIC